MRERLYYGGDIITMEEACPRVEAVVERDERIAYAGTLSGAREAFPAAEPACLSGRTLLPAFLDAHSHLSSAASALLQADLEACTSLEDIAERLHAFIREQDVKEGTWVIAKGYDHNSLPDAAHPTRAFLDACCPSRPAVLQHASGHMGVFNSRALAVLGVTKDTRSPDGGRMDFDTGYMEENAFFQYLKQLPMADAAALLDAYRRAQRIYAAHGITTIQEGYAVAQMAPLYQALLKSGALTLDLVAYAGVQDCRTLYQTFSEYTGAYRDHLRFGGIKIFLDGSPQGRTAWMRTPYLGGKDCGSGTMTDAAVLEAVQMAVENGYQLLAHCNGDAAAEQYLRALETVNRKTPVAAIRPVMIHAQLLGLDQLERVKALNVIPSFFVAHVYHWGDTHIKNFGMERASKISPVRSAMDRGILCTFHQDTPVIAPDMLETVWCAVNRRTKAGVLLDEKERVRPWDALKAVTINAAYQYFEEREKGSLAVGKRADFALLSANPLEVPPEEIRSIKVEKTVMAGRELDV